MICACLPSLNIVISKLRSQTYKSNAYYNQDSSVQLSRMKGTNRRSISKNMSRPDGENENEFDADESHLISYAGAVAGGQDGKAGKTSQGRGVKGIQKTVDVQQTVEVVEGRGSGSGSGSGSQSPTPSRRY